MPSNPHWGLTQFFKLEKIHQEMIYIDTQLDKEIQYKELDLFKKFSIFN